MMGRALAIVGRFLETPLLKDLSDISGRLAIPGNAACAFHGAGTRIVGRHREVNHAEPVEHLPQIPRSAEDVCHRIEAIEDPEFFCRGWHQLSKTCCACGADGEGVVSRFCPYERIEQACGQ